MRDKRKQGRNSGAIPEQDSDVKYFNPESQSRRDFLEGTGATVVAGAAATALGIPAASAQQTGNISARTAITLVVNGARHSVEVEDRWTLAELLRDRLDLTGTKIGCNRSECGACTVLMNGQPVYSCSQLAVWADGASIQTVEGLVRNGQLSPVQEAFVENNGPQCGFCTPGQLMTATALLNSNPSPNSEEVREAMVGNLCRCSNYNAIVEAVVAAGEGENQGGVV
ncbi:MAG: (2Fe-2S)-binding protein [Pseudomonadota bacterium]|nr:(2Fe-2S)-binding protein [Pseudomonadota bacterium]MEE2608902.1 (2Fe-2S)-binding protein [Pseudomonadota bacterium]|tara:strand:+ start:1154 stop:1831 length:678 start_codon:yes stop_codon:yes gene_type:complete